LISQKLEAQEKLVGNGLSDIVAAQAVSCFREAITTAQSIEAVRLFESRAARTYWRAWKTLSINFPKSELRRVPEHWRTFGTRVSLLTGSPRLAVNPPNAMLNYLYALLESETRLAVAALGLDPGLGILHVDTQCRDSFALDVMESRTSGRSTDHYSLPISGLAIGLLPRLVHCSSIDLTLTW